MTRNSLLDALKSFTEDATKDLLLPTRIQKEDEDHNYRPALVFKMRLPDGKTAQKKAPYVLHQVITGKDQQQPGNEIDSITTVRSICCVYCADEQEGGLMLLNLMERIRISILRKVVIDDQFEIDLEQGMESIVYPDDTAPYYVGEIISTWKMPKIKREVPELWQ